MYSQLVLIFYLETVKLPLVPGLLSNWVPEVSLDRCVLSARCTNQNCKTVSDAVEVIERYEAILEDTQEKKKSTV
jgi:hypothetical protein